MNYLRNLSRLLRSSSNKPAARRPNPPPPPRNSQSAAAFLHSSTRPTTILQRHNPAAGGLARYNNDRHHYHGYSTKARGEKLSTWQKVFTASSCAAMYYCAVNGSFETVPCSNRTHFIAVPPDEERKMGESIFASMKEAKEEEGKLLPESHPDSVRVNRLAMEIVRAANKVFPANASKKKKKKKKKKQPQTEHLDGLEWEVIVVQDESVNACCLPGGKIMVYTGFLDHFNTDAELATMLGHQVGHVIARHTSETLTDLLYLFIVTLYFQVLWGDSKSKREAVEGVMELCLRLSFSREMELEADHIGILLLAASGYDPRNAPAVYEKLGKITEKEDSKEDSKEDLKDFPSTHPSSEKRSEVLSQAKVMDEAMEVYRKAVKGGENKGVFFVFHYANKQHISVRACIPFWEL